MVARPKGGSKLVRFLPYLPDVRSPGLRLYHHFYFHLLSLKIAEAVLCRGKEKAGATGARVFRAPSVAPGEPLVDLADLLHPLMPLGVFQFEDAVERPVEVVSDVGYLLVQTVRGVADYSPESASSEPSSGVSSLILR